MARFKTNTPTEAIPSGIQTSVLRATPSTDAAELVQILGVVGSGGGNVDVNSQ